MRHVRRPLMLLAAVALAASLLAAGCGDTEENNDYVEQVNQIQGDLVTEVTEATTESTPTSQKEAADFAGTLAEIFNGSADDVEATEPPEDVADLHAQLVEQIRSIADQTSEVEDTLRTGTPAEAQQALSALQTAANASQSELDSLIGQINDQLQD